MVIFDDLLNLYAIVILLVTFVYKKFKHTKYSNGIMLLLFYYQRGFQSSTNDKYRNKFNSFPYLIHIFYRLGVRKGLVVLSLKFFNLDSHNNIDAQDGVNTLYDLNDPGLFQDQ